MKIKIKTNKVSQGKIRVNAQAGALRGYGQSGSSLSIKNKILASSAHQFKLVWG